jgi:hypothetical protein
MNALEFVSSLKKIPTKERLSQIEKQGLGQDFLEEYIGCFTFKQIRNNRINNPIEELVNNFDGSSVEIGMITFDIEPFDHEDYFVFGRFEIDFLVISKRTGEIKLIDHEDESNIMYECASGSSVFLKAILEAAAFLDKLPYKNNLANDQKQICEMAESCSSIAGGNKYIGFYKTLLGCFE